MENKVKESDTPSVANEDTHEGCLQSSCETSSGYVISIQDSNCTVCLVGTGYPQYTVWPENLAGIIFGGSAVKGCEMHLAD